jgi:hypothetical protein
MPARESNSDREAIEARRGDKRYVRPDDKGQFTESDDVSRSLRKHVKQAAERTVQKGQGDKGDQARKKER